PPPASTPLSALPLHDALPIFAFGAPPSFTFTWTGASNDSLSGVPGNWSPNGAPNNISSVIFGTSGQTAPQTNAAIQFFSIFFTSDRKSTRLNSSHEWISYAVF